MVAGKEPEKGCSDIIGINRHKVFMFGKFYLYEFSGSADPDDNGVILVTRKPRSFTRPLSRFRI